MFKCPLTNKSYSAAIKSPKARKFRMATYTRNSLDAKLLCDTKLWCEDFNIQQSAPLIHRFNHCERLQAGSGLPSACERLGSKELILIFNFDLSFQRIFHVWTYKLDMLVCQNMHICVYVGEKQLIIALA